MASWLVWQLASAHVRVLFPSLRIPFFGVFCAKKRFEWIHHVLHLLLWFNYADRQGINRNVLVGTLTNGLNCNCLQITGREHQYWHRRAVGAQRQSMRGLSGLSRWRAPTSCLINIYSLHIRRKIIVLTNINSNFCAASFTAGQPNCSLLWWVILSGFVGLFSNECQKSVIFHWRIMDEKHNLRSMSLFVNSSSLLWRAH